MTVLTLHLSHPKQRDRDRCEKRTIGQTYPVHAKYLHKASKFAHTEAPAPIDALALDIAVAHARSGHSETAVLVIKVTVVCDPRDSLPEAPEHLGRP